MNHPTAYSCFLLSTFHKNLKALNDNSLLWKERRFRPFHPFTTSPIHPCILRPSESVSSDRKTGMWNVESTFSPSPFTESKWVSTHYKTCVRLKAENTQFFCRAIYSLFTTSAGFSLAAIFMLNRFIHRRQQLILLSNWILPLKPFI